MFDKKSSPFIFLGILAIGTAVLWFHIFTLRPQEFLEVDFFDIGQGDAIFIETPSRRQILIDGGPSKTILEKLNQELSFFDRKIDILILTHPDSDHLNGLVEAAKKYKIGMVLMTGVKDSLGQYRSFQDLISKNKVLTIYVKQGYKIKIEEGTELEILAPFEDLKGKTVSSSNNASIVAKLNFGSHSFLFTGDAEKQEEKQLIESGENINSDILKVSHHGSKSSSQKEFLEKVSPQIAVIQAGKNNRYGHPHQEVLERLAGIKIYRTDVNGDVEILSDGEKLTVSAEK